MPAQTKLLLLLYLKPLERQQKEDHIIEKNTSVSSLFDSEQHCEHKRLKADGKCQIG